MGCWAPVSDSDPVSDSVLAPHSDPVPRFPAEQLRLTRKCCQLYPQDPVSRDVPHQVAHF